MDSQACAAFRIDEPRVVRLHVYHEQMPRLWIPGQAVWAGSHIEFASNLTRGRIDDQDTASTSCRREYDVMSVLRAEHPTCIRTARQCSLHSHLLAVDDFNSAICRVRDKDPSCRSVHIAVVEATSRMLGQANLSEEYERRVWCFYLVCLWCGFALQGRLSLVMGARRT